MAGKKQKAKDGALTRISSTQEMRASMALTRRVRNRVKKFIDSTEAEDPVSLSLQVDMAAKLQQTAAKAVETITKVRRELLQSRDELTSLLDDQQFDDLMARAALKRGYVKPSLLRDEVLERLLSVGMDESNARQLVSLLLPDRQLAKVTASKRALLRLSYDKAAADLDAEVSSIESDVAEVRAALEGRGDPEGAN